MKEQIEEMVQVLARGHHEMDVAWTNYFCDATIFPKPKPEHIILAEVLYNAGYRKQKEGEWIEHIEKPDWLEDDVEVYYNCSVCGTSHWSITSPFCPNCGSKMKGGAE